MRPIWKAPYLVVQVNHPLYAIGTQKRGLVLHHDNLKPCYTKIFPYGFRELETSCGELSQSFPVPAISLRRFRLLQNAQRLPLMLKCCPVCKLFQR